MKPPCEVIATEVLPAARALVAKKLVQKYGLSQKKTAELLGLSQPAVSQYRRNLRGFKLNIFQENPEIMELVDSLARKVATGLPVEDQTVEFRDMCRTMLKEGLVCDLHRRKDPSLQDCTVCVDGRFKV